MLKWAVLVLVLTVGFSIPGMGRAPSPRGHAIPPAVLHVNWDHYHNYSEMTDILSGLEALAPGLAELISIGTSWSGSDIWALAITNKTVGEEKEGILLVGYHHARERISLEVPLYIAWRLVSEALTNETVAFLLEQAVFYIIPALNPDGITVSELNPWQRKNLRPVDDDGDGLIDEDPPEDVDGDGKIYYWWNDTAWGFEGVDNDGDGLLNEDWLGGVDLNRNYGFHWGDPSAMSGSPNPSDEDYRGPDAFSEPETQALRDFVLGEQTEAIALAFSYHSGATCVLYPWAYTSEPCPDEEELQRLAKTYGLVAGYPYEGWDIITYTCSGDWGDWMYGVVGALPLTIEVYGRHGDTAWWDAHEEEVNGTYYFKDVWEYFNPPEKEIEDICEKNYQAVLATVFEFLEISASEELPASWDVALAFLSLLIAILALIIVLSLPGRGAGGWRRPYRFS